MASSCVVVLSVLFAVVALAAKPVPLPIDVQIPALTLPALGSVSLPSIPAAVGQTNANFAFADVHWGTLDLSQLSIVLAADGWSSSLSIQSLALLSQPVAFSMSQTVLGNTISCSGTLATTANVASVVFSIPRNTSVPPSVAVNLGAISTQLSFNSGLCTIAASLTPSLTDAVSSVASAYLSRTNITDTFVSVLRNVSLSAIMDKINNATNGTVPSWAPVQAVVSAALDVFVNGTIPQPVADVLHNPASVFGLLQPLLNRSVVDPAQVLPMVAMVLATAVGLPAPPTLPFDPAPIAGIVASLLASNMGPSDLFQQAVAAGASAVGSLLSSNSSLNNSLNLNVSHIVDAAMPLVNLFVLGIPPLGDIAAPAADALGPFIAMTLLPAIQNHTNITDVVETLKQLNMSKLGDLVQRVASALRNATADIANSNSTWNASAPSIGGVFDLIRCIHDQAVNRPNSLMIDSMDPSTQTITFLVNGTTRVQVSPSFTLPPDVARLNFSNINEATGKPELFAVTYTEAMVSWTTLGTASSGRGPLGAQLAVSNASFTLRQAAPAVFHASSALTPSQPLANAIDDVANAVKSSFIPAVKNCSGVAQPPMSMPPIMTFPTAPQSPPPMTMIPPPPPCPYRCPDGTCAAELKVCSCVAYLQVANVTAQFIGLSPSMQADPRFAISATASGDYGIVGTTNCSTYPFRQYLRFNWTVYSSAGAIVVTSLSSNLVLAPFALAGGQNYTLVASAMGFHGVSLSASWTVAVVAPAPTVSITSVLGTNVRISNRNSLTIPAKVEDPLPVQNPAFNWTCMSNSVDCTAMLVNATLKSVVIPANSTAGVYNISFTYRGNYTSNITVEILQLQIPVVRVLVVSSSVAPAGMPLFLWGSNIYLAVAYTGFSDATNITWYVNGQLNTSSVVGALTVNSSNLWTTALSSVQSALTANKIVARVTSAANASVFGEAQVQVAVLEQIAVALTVSKLSDSAATSATALGDALLLVAAATPALASLPVWLSSEFAFGYVDGGSSIPLRTLPSGSNFQATAPLPQSGANTTLSFFVALRINSATVARGSFPFAIVVPDISTAAQAQIQQASGVTDAGEALSMVGNMRALMNAGSGNTTQTGQLAAAMATMLSNSVTNASSLSDDQQNLLFSTLATAMTVGSSSDKTSMQNTTKTFLTQALSSGALDPSNGNVALTAISSLAAADSGALAVQLANVMANNPSAPVGVPQTLQTSTIIITTVKQSASSLGGTSLGSNGTSMSLPAGFSLSNVDPNTLLSGASTTFTTNPYGADGANQPQGSVSSFEFTASGTAVAVTGLTTPITISMPSVGTTAVCKYWDTALLSWSTSGVTTVVVGGVVSCQTTHLTAFATFSVGSTPTPAPSPSSSLSSYAAIIGGVIGGVIGATILVLIVIFFVSKKKPEPANITDHQPNPIHGLERKGEYRH